MQMIFGLLLWITFAMAYGSAKFSSSDEPHKGLAVWFRFFCVGFLIPVEWIGDKLAFIYKFAKKFVADNKL